MKFFIYLLSIFFMTIGLTFIIIYTNLFSFGYTFFEYLEFVLSKIECILFFIGFIMLIYIFKSK